ncbi:MAG TPA: hypothetical protein VJM31_15595 [Vicinamibacterales bacterium]|nr:hypothetical protein [Vicinamibacterales bacterium]
MKRRISVAVQGRGRPRKYGRPSRAITVTLPEDVLARLSRVDTDLGRAIVGLVERRAVSRMPAVRPAEIASYGNHAVIVVTPVKALKRLRGVQLVPIGNGRCLIALEPPHSISQLELDIRDVLARDDMPPTERETLDSVAQILRSARVSRDTRPEERTIIVLEQTRSRRTNGSVRSGER